MGLIERFETGARLELVAHLKDGRVVIELAPAFAPRHVAQIKALARQDRHKAETGEVDGEEPMRGEGPEGLLVRREMADLLERALRAPPRPGREVADAGRRAEIGIRIALGVRCRRDHEEPEEGAESQHQDGRVEPEPADDAHDQVALRLLDLEDIGLHYARTLRHWLDRYEAQAAVVERLFDRAFVRAWRLYLAGSIAAFTTAPPEMYVVLDAYAPLSNGVKSVSEE